MGVACSSTKPGTMMPKKKHLSAIDMRKDVQRDNSSENYKNKKNSKRNSIFFDEPIMINAASNGSKGKLPLSNEDLKPGDKPNPLNQSYGSHTTGDNSPRRFQYKKGPMIGKGCFAEVYECLNLLTGELLAVKSIKMNGDIVKVQSYIESVRKEIGVLKNLDHQNIVKYYMTDVNEVKDQGCTIIDVVHEYVSGGSVRVLLDKFSKLDEGIVHSYTKQILEGLVYLHFNNIIHRDIKGSNVLIDANGKIKLTDFGSAKRLDKMTEDHQIDQKANIYWMSPEVAMSKPFGKAADIWSVGCVVIEMLTGLPPWSKLAKSPEEAMNLIISGTLPPLPMDISQNCRDFLYRTLKFRPEDRPTALELLDHPFVREGGSGEFLDTDSMNNMNSNVGNYNFLEPQLTQENKYIGIGGYNFNTQSSNISMSGINLSRLNSNNTTSHRQTPPDTHISGFGKLKTNEEPNHTPTVKSSFNSESNTAKSRYTNKNIIREEPEEETPTIKKSFFKSSLANKESQAILDEENLKELERMKAEKRRKWEEEMQKELERIASDKLGIALAELEKSQEDELKKEEKRKKWEEQMKNELAGIDSVMLNKKDSIGSNDEQLLSEAEIEKIKQEKRKKWEKEMEAELNNIDSVVLSRFSLGGATQSKPELNQEDLEKIKADQRRQYEIEMEKELAKIGSVMSSKVTELRRIQTTDLKDLRDHTKEPSKEEQERLKAEKRRKWEEEMQNELKRISTDKLKNTLDQLGTDNSEIILSNSPSQNDHIKIDDLENEHRSPPTNKIQKSEFAPKKKDDPIKFSASDFS